jgi:hypothetical protein
MKKELEKNQLPEQASVKIPRYGPGILPKRYNVKRSISIFCCLRFSFGFKCPEALRATITTKGDVYVIPYTEYGLGDFHISHHKSGEFHWGYQGNHIQPICGEDDAPAAMRLWLKLKQPPCFCFRKGRNLNDEEIVTLIQRLAQNLPFTFNVEKASHNLKNTKFYRMVVREHV